MPNPIKYSASAQTLALKKGNYWIGTGDVGKGPTSTTDYYNGITPPSGGYTIYLNKASGGPSIYTAANDSQLISLSNIIAGQTFATAAAALDWFAAQTDKMVFNRDYESVITNGLILNLDAGFTPSYPTTGTSWYDLIQTNTSTLVNGPTFNSGNGGYISFDGTNDQVNVSSTTPASLQGNPSFTIDGWFKRNANMSQGSTWGIGGNGSPNGITSWNAGSANKISIDLWGTSTYSTGQDYSLTQFRYVAWTYNGSSFTTSNIIIYVDTVPYTGNNLTVLRGGSGTPSINNDGIVLAKSSIIENGQWTPVDIANFRIYNRVLTAAEITQNYNAQKSRFGL